MNGLPGFLEMVMHVQTVNRLHHLIIRGYRSKDIFVSPEEKKKRKSIASLALALTFNHFTNELFQTANKLYGLMHLTYGRATDYKHLIRCMTDYKWLLK